MDEDDPQVVRRLLEEVHQTSRFGGWLAVGISALSAVAAVVAALVGEAGPAVFCLFIAVLMAIVAVGNLALSHKMGQDLRAEQEPERQDSVRQKPDNKETDNQEPGRQEKADG